MQGVEEHLDERAESVVSWRQVLQGLKYDRRSEFYQVGSGAYWWWGP